MARRSGELEGAHTAFVRACQVLERVGRPLGISAAKELTRSRRRPGRHAVKLDALMADLELGEVRCSAQTVAAAAKSLAALTTLTCVSVFLMSVVYLGPTHQVAALIMVVASPPLSHKSVVAFPTSAARKRAAELMRNSADAVNLMVMGVRQDASLPKAIEFASEGGTVFAKELRRCTWEVITGTHTGFEDAVHALGCRWERFSSELKTSLNAIVVASHEATEEGKRRSLERANRAMVAGAKRRVEEYALSLSMPSMLLFGLGILLPIMVGSFMPMLSWDIFSGGGMNEPLAQQGGGYFEMAMVMDLMFPVVALLVAMDAVSRRPVDRRGHAAGGCHAVSVWAIAAAVGAAGSYCAHVVLGAGAPSSVVLLAGSVPASALLMLSSSRNPAHPAAKDDEVQDLLFRAGARLLEGDNFESALHRASDGGEGSARPLGSRLCLKAFVLGHGFEGAVESEAPGERVNALEALKVVGKASTKDEAGAGMLAMDLASYLRELSEIESTLKMRLRPTISMMRMTAHVLGPIVLGVTFAIYLSLGSVAGGYGDSAVPDTMLLVLGLFLAEMNAVVCYFVWGIEGRWDTKELARSVGACMLVSQLVFVSTATLVS